MSKDIFFGKVFISNSFEKTQGLGRDFAKTLKRGDIVSLYGDLGSGKTTFAKGLAEGLGIKNRITSPTFVIVRCYELQAPSFAKASAGKQNSKRKTQNYNSKFKSLERFYHIDLYRTESERDVEGLGIEEIINNENNIVVIEWAEKLKSYLPRKRIDVKFFYVSDKVRKIMFSLTT